VPEVYELFSKEILTVFGVQKNWVIGVILIDALEFEAQIVLNSL